MDNNINVKISGSDIYRAVSNHINNTPDFQKQIIEKVIEKLWPVIESKVSAAISAIVAKEKAKIVRDDKLKLEVEQAILSTKITNKIKGIVKQSLRDTLLEGK